VKILFFDLETSPIEAYTWGLWDQNIAISQIKKPTEVICFGARWYGSKKIIFRSVHHDGREAMLDELHKLFDEADVMVGWNSRKFDHKHVRREFLSAGYLPPSPARDLDLMEVVKANFNFPSNKLDYVAQALGVGSKVKHEGFDLWLKCLAGDETAWRKMRQYQLQDVNLLVDLYEKLKPWMGSKHPNIGIYTGLDCCPVCGSDRITARGYLMTQAGKFQRYQCQECGKWSRGKSAIGTNNVRTV
jgi:uncharacterized protein YprB with RNaseH-like and TPR domain